MDPNQDPKTLPEEEKTIWFSTFGPFYHYLKHRRDIDPQGGAWYASNLAVEAYRNERCLRISDTSDARYVPR